MPEIRPNILLITLDQMRFDALRHVGNSAIDTPYMDELAAAGVRFPNAFSECPACVPARRCLMTGRDMYANRQFNNAPQSTFTDKGPFLAECLHNADYQTHSVGKMHVSPPRFRVGFDEVILDEESRRQDGMRRDDYHAYLSDRGLLESLDRHAMPSNGYHARPSVLPEEHCHDAWVAKEACRFLERRDPTVPFFLYVSFRNPHPPLCPPQHYWDRYRDRQVPLPRCGDWAEQDAPALLHRLRADHNIDNAYSAEDRERAIRAYYGLVTSIDHQIGQILGQLGSYWQNGKTMVILTADHGDMLFDHGSLAKSQYYRSAAGIPFIMVPPPDLNTGIPRGEQREQPVMLQDVMPTILDLCGVPIPETCTGTSLLPVLRGDVQRSRDYAFGAYSQFGDCQATGGADQATYCIHDEQYKYIYYVEEGREQLFAVADRWDEHDLGQLPEHAETLAGYREHLRRELAAHGDGNLVANELRRIPGIPPKPKKGIQTQGAPAIAGWPSIPYEQRATEESFRKLYR
jgi:arylsulfatase